MANEEIREWDIFKRLEAIEPTLKDACGIAALAFWLAFQKSAEDSPNPRGVKDELVETFKETVSPEIQKALEKLMLSICEAIEKKRQQTYEASKNCEVV